MGVRFPQVSSTTIQTASIPTTETLVGLSPPLTISLDFSLIIILGYVNWTIGTNGTAMTVRLRRGNGVSGAAVLGTPIVNTFAAATSLSTQFCYVDTPGAVAGQQYSLTLQQTAGTGNGSANDVCIIAFAL